jgi:nitrogen fixation protein
MSNELIFNPYIPQKDDEEPQRSPRNEATWIHYTATQKKFWLQNGEFEN